MCRRMKGVMGALTAGLAILAFFGAGPVSAQPVPTRFVMGGSVMRGEAGEDYVATIATPKPTSGWFRREFCLRAGLYDNTLTLGPYQSAVTVGSLTSGSSIRCSGKPDVPRFMLHDVAGQLAHWLGWRQVHFRYDQRREGAVPHDTGGFRSGDSDGYAALDRAFRRALCAQTNQVDVTGQGFTALLQGNASGLVVCAAEGAVRAVDQAQAVLPASLPQTTAFCGWAETPETAGVPDSRTMGGHLLLHGLRMDTQPRATLCVRSVPTVYPGCRFVWAGRAAQPQVALQVVYWCRSAMRGGDVPWQADRVEWCSDGRCQTDQ